jgi:misacylated tRNA(Ala) deacylase
MSPAPTPSYVELPRAPSLEEIQRLNTLCNQFIRDGAPVTITVSLQDQDQRDSLSKIPDDYQGGVVREMRIHHDQLPAAVGPCCGTHLPNLSMLQAIHVLPNVTSIRGTNSRLYFLVGGRVLDNAGRSMEVCRLAALELGGTEDVVGRVQATTAA